MSGDENAAPIQPKRSVGGEENMIPVTSCKILNKLDESVVIKWHPFSGPMTEAHKSPIAPGAVWDTEGGKCWNGSWFGLYRADGTLICNFNTRDEAVVLLDGTPRDYCFQDPN